MEMIQVLLSSYNGAENIREQLETIYGQDCEEKMGVRVSVLVRDDGSSDKTQEILKEYEKKHPADFSWYQGENIGVIRSFFDLISHSDSTAAYYALSDQDDFWEAGKLSAGLRWQRQQENRECPHLYCCKPLLVDEKLQPLHSEIKRPPMRPSFGNALVENIVPGCTIVMDRVLRDMVKAAPPRFTVMHDWWLYLVASCFGRVYYDETPYIRYRQHGDNTVGMNISLKKELVDRIRRFRGNRQNISKQTLEFLRIYGKEARASRNLRLARALAAGKHSGKMRIRLVKSRKIYRQRKNDDRIFRLIILSGSY